MVDIPYIPAQAGRGLETSLVLRTSYRPGLERNTVLVQVSLLLLLHGCPSQCATALLVICEPFMF